MPYLADVSLLEWHIDRAATQAVRQPFPFEKLQQLPAAQQPQLVFHCAPGVALLDSDFPALGIWQGVRENHLDGLDMAQAEAVLICPAVIGEAQASCLSIDAQQLLQAIMQSKTLARCLELPTADADFNPQRQLQHWINQGVINDFKLEARGESNESS